MICWYFRPYTGWSQRARSRPAFPKEVKKMGKKVAFLLCFVLLSTAIAFPQGLETSATKDDWEEINFEFDSSVLVDGFPSLLRLADLLSKNAAYRVTVEGHADYRGTDQYKNISQILPKEKRLF
jgi:outer membrane protein OmpA-like peptidoglycan-associated protein